MDEPPLSLTEYAVLGLLAEGPAHGFALSKELASTGEIGRIITVRRPLVYRALDRLVASGMAQPRGVEPGNAGPKRTIHWVTRRGRNRLGAWLAKPVAHVRDMRIEFQLKLILIERSGRSPLELVRAQRSALGPTITALEETPAGFDHLELWRRHNAIAAANYLEHLERIYSAG
jgi:PadR family transcriptional regulator AphA